MKAPTIAVMVLLAGCAPDRPTTSLLDATKSGNVEQVEAHLYWCRKEGGCDVNARDKNGEAPLEAAVIGGHARVAKILIEGGADVNAHREDGKTPLYFAVESGNAAVAKALLAAGADVNARATEDAFTPLVWAALLGRAEVVNALIEGGADVNARNQKGMTPLMAAGGLGPSVAARGSASTDIAKALIEGGADVNALSTGGEIRGMTALSIAADIGQADLVEVLIDAGADVNARDSYGWTPLRWAANKNHTDVAAILRAHGGTE